MISKNFIRRIFIIISIPFITAFILIIFGYNIIEVVAIAQLIFSAVAFTAIMLTLYISLAQLRKSMAKPLIEVAFNQEGKQQTTLTYKEGKLEVGLPSLPHPWLINRGNVVARYFQIDFIIPENIARPGPYITLWKDDGNYILSYTNEGRYTLFVNRPSFDVNMLFSSAFDVRKCIEVYKDSFEIKYRIYGDWAEIQEGKLKVNINKQ
jgi:hypothetical protein